MYIKDGICYAGKLEEGIKVTDAKPLRGGIMLVTFSTGEQRLFDTTLLKGAAFEPLHLIQFYSYPCIAEEKYSKRDPFLTFCAKL